MPQTSPRDQHVWIFNSAQFNGNPKWLMIYVTQHRPDIEAYWLADNATIQRQVNALGFRAITVSDHGAGEILRRAGVYVVNQVKEVISPDLEGAVLLNLWHGVGVKGIERGMNEGYLRERIAKKYITNNQAYHDHQLFLVTSPLMERHFTKHIGLDEEVTIRGGYPQNVYPRLHPGYSSFDHDLRARKGLPAETRLALYAPTPRRTRSTVFLDEAFPDLPRLNDALREANTLLMIKVHPHMTNDPSFRRLRELHGGLSHLHFWDNAEDVYEIAPQIDLAIMDYSSILYDLIAAGVRAHIRYIFDADGGEVLAGGELDYMSLSCGTIARSFDQLVDAVGQDNTVPDAELSRLSETFWEYSSADSLEHIVERALRFRPRRVTLPTLYSYDVFDTVMHRRGVEPLSVFAYVEQLMSAAGGFPSHLVAHFADARRQAESAVRQNRKARANLVASGDLEVTLGEIYRRMQSLYGLTDAQVDRLMTWEQECEIAGSLPNPAIIEEILARKAAGDDVVLISDQYLPEDTIRAMLRHADPRLDAIPLYLSNTRRAQKTTRRLFLHVYDDLPFDHAAWIHTGDNAFADVQQPSRLGITTRKLDTPELNKHESRLVEHSGTFDSYLVAGMLHAMRRELELTSKDLFAIRHVSFYLVPYIDWVVRDAVERGYRKLWFISRDGHHMRRIADEIIATRGLDLKTGYIYGSRRAWRLPAMLDAVDDDFFLGHGSFAGAPTVRRVLESAELTTTDFLRLFPDHADLLHKDAISRAELNAIAASLRASPAYHEHLLKIAAVQREVMLDYFRQEVDDTEPHAFVEYWGRGYTQDCLTRVLQSASDDPVVVPFYYARSIYPSEGGSVRHNFTAAEHSLLFIEALFANLPYGTVEGYERQGERIVPIYTARENDAELHAALERMLPEFARRYAALPTVDIDRLDREMFEFGFTHYAQKPDSKVYVEHLAHLKDSITMGGVEREFAPALTLRDFVDHLKGTRLQSKTTSLPLSLARSSATVQTLAQLQESIGFRRNLKKVKRRLKRN